MLNVLDRLCNEAPKSMPDARCENKFNQQDVWDLYSNDDPDIDNAIGNCYCCDKSIFRRTLVTSIRLDLDLSSGSWRACPIVVTRASKVKDYRPCCWICYREIVYYGRDMREYVCMRGYANHTRFSMQDLAPFLQRRQLLSILMDRNIIQLNEDTVVSANDIVANFVRRYLYSNMDRRKLNADILYCGTSYFIKAESLFVHYHALCRDMENTLTNEIFIHALDSLCSGNWLLHGPIQLMLVRHTSTRRTTSSRNAPYPNYKTVDNAAYYQIVDEKALEICTRKSGMICVLEPRAPRPVPSISLSSASTSLPILTHRPLTTSEDVCRRILTVIKKYVDGKSIDTIAIDETLQQCLNDPEIQGQNPLIYMSLFSIIVGIHTSH